MDIFNPHFDRIDVRWRNEEEVCNVDFYRGSRRIFTLYPDRKPTRYRVSLEFVPKIGRDPEHGLITVYDEDFEIEVEDHEKEDHPLHFIRLHSCNIAMMYCAAGLNEVVNVEDDG